MKDTLTEYEQSLAFICASCGTWLPEARVCQNCGQTPRPEWMPFYLLALRVDQDVERELQWRRMFNAQRVNRPTHTGAGTEILGIISAIVLGILSNASYDLIKSWLLSKRKRAEAESALSHVYKYEVLVEILVEHFQNAPALDKMVRDALMSARDNAVSSAVPETIASALADQSAPSVANSPECKTDVNPSE